MMTDTSSHSAVASVVPHTDAGVVKVTDTPVALRAVSHTIGTCELYYDYLVRHILTNPACRLARGPRKRHYDRLANAEAMLALALVWKESPCVTRKHLACAGFTRSFPGGITRHALGNALQKSDRRPLSYQSANMFARRAQRIAQSAIAYGLVEEKKIRPNYKPLRATKKLNDLMAEIGSEAAVLMLAPPGGSNACGLARPLDDDSGEGGV